MVLGAAVGWQEEREFRPFVGPPGLKMMGILDEIGIDEAYFTNVTSCVPLDHGEPDKPAVRACRPRLEEEIERVKPRFVLALGNLAVQRLLGKGTISALSGKEQWSGRYACWVLPAYHPTYLLRSPGREAAWRLDLHRYGRLARGDIVLPGKPDCRVNLVESTDDLRRLYLRLGAEPSWTFDFETNAIDWWHRDFRARSIAFSVDGQSADVLLLDHPENPVDPRLAHALLRSLSEGASHTRVAHNALFDALVWYRLTGHLPRIGADTMVMAHLLDENRPKSLKWLGRALLGWPDWDLGSVEKKGGEGVSLEDWVFYGGADACATYRLWELFNAQLAQDERLSRYWHRLEMPKLNALIKMAARGIYVDRDRVAAQKEIALANWERDKQTVPVENPASPEQVAHWLFDLNQLNLIPLKMGKKHGSTDESSIKRLSLEHPEVRAILPVRKWRRYVDTYFSPIEEMVAQSYDGRYHPDLRSCGTETGRLSSPFHTVPRPTVVDGPFVRSIFSAPPGYVLIEADYSQIEARLAAWAAAGKPATWEALNPDRGNMLLAWGQHRDVYAEQAAQNIYGDPMVWSRVTKDERQRMGKVPVLAMLYRIGIDGLRDYAWREYEIDWTKKQAARVWMGFHRLWPEFKAWHEREERILRARGWTQTAIGRVRRLPEAMGWGKPAAEAVGAGINAPIQGLASDCTQQSLVLLDQQDQRLYPRLFPVGDVHDALLVQVEEQFAPQAVVLMRRVMVDHMQKALRELGLRLPAGLIEVEIKVGAWGAGKEVLTPR